ncbi:thymidylate synthase family protein [Actinomadura napierensis]|uniref:Thymidylate synthase n=1 Tax=Actinomadura napierensis TaxID=267854 RepID=A0ABN2ZMP5_9ACTN
MQARDNDVRRWETCGRAWIGVLRHVWAAGVAGMEDVGPIIEGPPLMFEISSLSWEDPILLKHGDRDRIARRAQERARDAVTGRYGPRLRDLDGVDQLRWVVGLLRARPWTTSAWISLTLPGEDAAAVPCLTALSFRIRGYRLIMTGMFRSQDVFRGYLAYIPLREVQLQVAEELGLPAGPLRVFVDVPHVRVAEAERVAAVLAAVPEPNAA